jgi:hypothetical protein
VGFSYIVREDIVRRKSGTVAHVLSRTPLNVSIPIYLTGKKLDLIE